MEINNSKSLLLIGAKELVGILLSPDRRRHIRECGNTNTTED